MRFRSGFLVCLLTGCVVQPAGLAPSADPAAPELSAEVSAATADGTAANADRPDAGVPAPEWERHAVQHVLRIGLEYLPPDDRLPEVEAVRAEPLPSPAARGESRPQPARTRRTELDEPTRTPRLSQIDFAAIDDPLARETLQFVSDMIEVDRQRVQREVGIPFFDFRQDDLERGPLLNSELALLAEHEEWLQENGASLLRRPFRRMLRRMPLVQQFELDLEDFRSDHVPLSEPYRQVHGDRHRLGRMSLRLHTSRLDDPLEVAYVHSGVRIGTSQDRCRLSVGVPLADNLHFELRAHSRYSQRDVGLRADLIFQPTSHMSLHLALGDDMDFLSTSSIYSLFESPMDGSPGLVLYAVHTF